MNVLRFITREIFYNGHFQTWGSLAIIISAGQLLHIKITWDLLAIVYLFTYLSYLNDRYIYLKIDSLTNIARSKHVEKIYRYIPSILIIGLIILLLLLYYFSNIYASFFVLISVVLGFLYPVYFKSFTRRIIAFKNFYVSSVFSILVILPNIYYKIPLTEITLSIVIILLTFTFLRGMMMQFFLDLKDIEGDKKEGLMTLGILLGKEKVFTIINILNIVTSLTLPILYFTSPSLMLPPAVLFLILLTIWNYYFFNLGMKGKYLGFILGSGEFIYWPLFVFIGQMIIS